MTATITVHIVRSDTVDLQDVDVGTAMEVVDAINA